MKIAHRFHLMFTYMGEFLQHDETVRYATVQKWTTTFSLYKERFRGGSGNCNWKINREHVPPDCSIWWTWKNSRFLVVFWRCNRSLRLLKRSKTELMKHARSLDWRGYDSTRSKCELLRRAESYWEEQWVIERVSYWESRERSRFLEIPVVASLLVKSLFIDIKLHKTSHKFWIQFCFVHVSLFPTVSIWSQTCNWKTVIAWIVMPQNSAKF